MPNPHRGEVTAMLDGRAYTLRLTLGALADLETALDISDLVALAERFERGSLTSREAIAIIGAGLRGAGQDVTDEDVARMTPDGGVAALIKTAATLLTKAFAG